MKKCTLLSVIAVFHCLSSFAGLEDTTCLKTRWVALKPSSVENASLFEHKTNTSILPVIQKLVQEKKVFIYERDYQFSIRQMVEPVVYNKEIKNAIDIFELEISSTIPLANMYGEDSIVIRENGDMEFVYPRNKKYNFSFEDIDEIRIKEERIFNTETQSYSFKPVAIGFCLAQQDEVFILYIDELMSNLEGNNVYPWKEVILNKKYSGFQYKQVSCYDDRIRN